MKNLIRKILREDTNLNESEDKDFSRDIGTPEELKDFLLINQEDIVDWVEEGIEEYPPGEIGEEDIKQWLRDFSGEITPGRFLLTYDDFTYGGYDEDMFRNVYKEFVEETYNKFFGVTDILGKLDGLKEDEDDWDWVRDVRPSLFDELEYLLRDSEFEVVVPQGMTIDGYPVIDIVYKHKDRFSTKKVMFRGTEEKNPTLQHIIDKMLEEKDRHTRYPNPMWFKITSDLISLLGG